ncbi:M20 family metallopeptidase [Halospeciosus flavus]|uniref:M20 family metallopeptidase n=1 Tax=Halospeciosus flavus TaxID=3032283 RepID=A0ABD5Z0R3_9EURY|nr:M20 family metallopeptidase [Halospeciosus flavus]
MAEHGRVPDVVDLARELVRLDSENPPGEEAACARFVHDWFAERGVDTELVEEPIPDRPQVAARVGEGDPTLVLNGHLDVVPADDPAEWTHEPYAAEVEDGRLYGRGAADMKSGLAVGMVAMLELREELADGDLDGSVVFHGAVGEETAVPGTKTLLERGYDGDYGVVLEPTDFRVATSAKGLVCYEVTVEGDPSHASRPDQGRNAVLEARPVVDAIETYDRRLREREDPLVGQAYANVTRFEAGVGGNLGVLPGTAKLVLDRRVLPAEEIADVRDEVDALLDDVREEHGVETRVEEIQRYESAAVDSDCELAETIRDHTAAVTGERPDPWGIEAATDVRNLVNDAGMEAVTWGPGELAQAHTYDESIAVSDVRDGLDVTLRVARDVLDGAE